MRMDIEQPRAVVAHHLGPRVRLAGAARMTGGTFDAVYRLHLSLIMLAETVPRGYDPQEHAPLAARARAELRTAVTRLEKAPTAAR